MAPLDPISSTIPRGRAEALLRHGHGGRAIRPGRLVPGGGRLSSTLQSTVYTVYTVDNVERKERKKKCG